MGAFEVSRTQYVEVPPDRVREEIVDFRRWRAWSPWEDADPELHRDYSEPSGGVGATYAWSGNRKAGAGSMEVTAVADDRVDIALRFQKPFPAENEVFFDLEPVDGGTQVTWRMQGTTGGLMGLFTKVVPMDRLVGKDFARGLDQLKAVVEAD